MILLRLDEDKAQDIVLIDLKDKSSVADTMVVASGRSHRHVGALADHILRALKDAGHGKARVEGLPHCDWVLIDAGGEGAGGVGLAVLVASDDVRVLQMLEQQLALGGLAGLPAFQLDDLDGPEPERAA